MLIEIDEYTWIPLSKVEKITLTGCHVYFNCGEDYSRMEIQYCRYFDTEDQARKFLRAYTPMSSLERALSD